MVTLQDVYQAELDDPVRHGAANLGPLCRSSRRRDTFDARNVRVRNRAGDELGDLDGFIVDEAGRPYYFVVDSGGWFMGRRYLVPVGNSDLGTAAKSLVVDLNKDVLKRYPEFHSHAFMSMTDEEARRYEWRVLEAIDPEAARRSPGVWQYEEFPYYTTPQWLGAGRPISGRERSVAGAPRTAAARPSDAERARVSVEDREAVIAREDRPEAARERGRVPSSDMRGESTEEHGKRRE